MTTLQISETKLTHDSQSNHFEAKAHHLMPKESPAVTYQALWARKDRIKKRWANGVVRAKEIPDETVRDMHTLHVQFNMSYEKIGQLYGLSRYLVFTALNNFSTSSD